MKRCLFVLLLAGCAGIEPEAFKGPNGRQAFNMECSGSGRTLSMCYQKAGEICPAGYNIVAQANGTVGVPAYGGTLMVPTNELAVECK